MSEIVKSQKVAIENLKNVLAKEYMKQIQNYFGDQKKALKFLSGVVSSIQRLPALLDCTPDSLINSFMIMAQLEFMPSAVSGEAYILPYKNKGVMEAQFQLGYQGIVTLLYKAGAKSVTSEIVRKNDRFTIINGSITHEIDPFKTKDERGEAMGAYAIIVTQTGGKVEKFMRKDEILKMGERFSKSWNSQFSPWKNENDPEGWMWRKTALKQAAKLAPKNETINLAIAEDNKDSDIGDRLDEAKTLSSGMAMGALVAGKDGKVAKKETTKNEKGKDSQEAGKEVSPVTEDNQDGEGAGE